MNIDEQIAAEIDAIVEAQFGEWPYMRVVVLPDHPGRIPIIGTIDSATGVITHTASLPEPPAPPAAKYAAGRMSHRARIIGALGIAAAVAIAAAVVLVERVKGRGEK